MSIDTIQRRLKILSDLQDEINKIMGLVRESLENDPEYQAVQEAEKKLKEETKDKKVKAKSAPTLKNMDDEVKELRRQVKENKEILAIELADYYKESGSLEIVDNEGNVKRVVFSVKLVNQ
jgi:hypothetical protein